MLEIKSGVVNKWNEIKTNISTAVENIKNKISAGFTNAKNAAVNTFNLMKTKVSSIFTALWTAIKNPINSILGGVEKMANGIINAINGMINALNGIRFDIPWWVPKYGGNSFGLNIPTIRQVSIPRLAQGAVIPPNREFLAVLGDQKHGTNIEAPLDTIVEAFKQAQGEISATPVYLNLDGKTIAKSVINWEKKLDFSYNR